MKKKIRIFSFVILTFFISSFSYITGQKSTSMIKEDNVTYTVDGVNLKGYVVYDQNLKGKRPAVLVVHEWWGLNDYPKMRARMLAELGYIAIAVDIFGGVRQLLTRRRLKTLQNLSIRILVSQKSVSMQQ